LSSHTLQRTGVVDAAVADGGPGLDRALSRVNDSAKSRHGGAELDVLLLDAEHRQTLAAMRVYARLGLRVGAVASASEAWWAPSLRSRWCQAAAAVSDLSTDAAGYADDLLAFLDDHPSRMLVPTHDGSIQAIRLRRADFERRTLLPLASESALSVAISKTRTLSLAAELGIRVPESIPLRDISDVGPAMRQVGAPAVLKPLESWVERGDGTGCRLSPNVVSTEDEAKAVLEHVLSEGGRGLIQPWLPGRREAVSVFYANGRIWARVAQVSYREWPILGGASTLCETISLLPDISEDAERLVTAMDLEGCSMVEFRRDRNGKPVLMEVNPRMGGSVNLAIAAGVNFPKLMADWKLHSTLEEVHNYKVGARLRWLPGDVWNLKCVFENQGHPDVPPKLAASGTFLMDFFRRRAIIDGVEFSDLRPTLAEMNKIVFRHSLKRIRNYFLPSEALKGEID
jgi:predicted ATP-grasp superfamily ATP-dependent carboligase